MSTRTLVVAAASASLLLLGTVASASLSFASIGDWGCVPIGGWHEQDQFIVAKQFAIAAEAVNAQFVLNTGDNFYYCGIEAKDSEWWQTTYENVFSEPSMMVPWFNTLGNHDYGYPTSVQAQIDYVSPNKNRWILPDRYYYRRITFPGQVNISLIVLDSSPCQADYRSDDASGWDPCGSVIPGCPGCTFHANVVNQSCTKQRAWLQATLPTIPQGDWKIVMNHAPAADINVDDLISDLQGANVDMYINGHVHLMAHYQMDGKGTYVTTGGGCMVRVPGSTPQDIAADPLNEKLMHLRRDKRAGLLGATSCPHPKFGHTCSLVYQKTIAGYSTHSFSPDFQTLYTYLYDYAGRLLHQLSVKKGTGGGSGSTSGSGVVPPPPGGSSSSSSAASSGTCCIHSSSKWCPAGETCCSDNGYPYDEANCKQWGPKHGCIWDAVDHQCRVHSSKAH